MERKIGFIDEESLVGSSCSHQGCPEWFSADLRSILTRWVPEGLSDTEVDFADFADGILKVNIAGVLCPSEETLKSDWNWPEDFAPRCRYCLDAADPENGEEAFPLVQWVRSFAFPCTRASAARFLRMLGAFGFANSVDGKYGGF